MCSGITLGIDLILRRVLVTFRWPLKFVERNIGHRANVNIKSYYIPDWCNDEKLINKGLSHSPKNNLQFD